MFKSDSDADTPALEKLDKILAEVKSDADREAKACTYELLTQLGGK